MHACHTMYIASVRAYESVVTRQPGTEIFNHSLPCNAVRGKRTIARAAEHHQNTTTVSTTQRRMHKAHTTEPCDRVLSNRTSSRRAHTRGPIARDTPQAARSTYTKQQH